MLRYIMVRSFQALIALCVLSIVIFYLARSGGDPTIHMLPADAPEEAYVQLRHKLGLDKPVYIQYGIFVADAIKGDFGTSIRAHKPVKELIGGRLFNSLKLVAVAMCGSFILGLPLGIIGAVRGGAVDAAVRIVAGLGQAIPVFWLGLMLMNLFSVQLGLLPTSGMGDWTHYIMPSFCLGWFVIAGIIRLIHSSMLDVLDREYIKLARIKGVTERVIVWKHALRNSLIPVVSFGGVYIAILITSAIVVETVFAWPGFGRLAYEAIMFRDFPVMQGVVLVAASIVIFANLLTDILYAYLDPRIKYERN